MKFAQEYRSKSDALQEIAIEYSDSLKKGKGKAELTPVANRFVEAWNQRHVMAERVASAKDLLEAIEQRDVNASPEIRAAFDLFHHNRALYHDVLADKSIDDQEYLVQMAVASGYITKELYYNQEPTISRSPASLLTSQWYEAGQIEDLHSHLDPQKVEAALHASALELVIAEHFPNAGAGFATDIRSYRDSYLETLKTAELLNGVSALKVDLVADSLPLLEAA